MNEKKGKKNETEEEIEENLRVFVCSFSTV